MRFGENRGSGAVGTRRRETVVEPVIGEAAAEGVEKLVALAQRVEEASEISNVDIRSRREFRDPTGEFRSADRKSLVGPEGGKHAGRQLRFRDCTMMTEIVGRIIGGADDFDVKFLKDALRGEIVGEKGVGALPDGRRGGFVEQVGDSEIALQLEMSPMIKGIAQGVGNGAGPSQEFFVRGGITGDVSFGDAIGTHGTPLVVVAFEPDLK